MMTLTTLIQELQAAVTTSDKTGNAEVFANGCSVVSVAVLSNGDVDITVSLEDESDPEEMNLVEDNSDSEEDESDGPMFDVPGITVPKSN